MHQSVSFVVAAHSEQRAEGASTVLRAALVVVVPGHLGHWDQTGLFDLEGWAALASRLAA